MLILSSKKFGQIFNLVSFVFKIKNDYILFFNFNFFLTDRELTDYQVEIDYDNNNYFPSRLPVLLKCQNRTIKFSFTKRDVDYNIPIYTRTKSMKPALLEMPPVKVILHFINLKNIWELLKSWSREQLPIRKI